MHYHPQPNNSNFVGKGIPEYIKKIGFLKRRQLPFEVRLSVFRGVIISSPVKELFDGHALRIALAHARPTQHTATVASNSATMAPRKSKCAELPLISAILTVALGVPYRKIP